MSPTATLIGQASADAHDVCAGEGPDHPQATAAPTSKYETPAGVDPRHANQLAASKLVPRGGHDIPDGHDRLEAHMASAVGEQAPEPTIDVAESTEDSSVSGHNTAATTRSSISNEVTSLPPEIPDSQGRPGTHTSPVVGDQPSANPAKSSTASNATSLGLADPTLALLADVLDDLERTRIANENRLRQLTRTAVDSDGEERGFGLSEDHPDVARLAGVVGGIAALEHQATLNLGRAMRRHPLGPWVKAQLGVGEKQAARLLAAIGDPYWNTLHNRPRTVSELWAYCGLHVIRVDQWTSNTQVDCVGAEQTGNPDHRSPDNHMTGVGVAARRRKGEKANWSTAAKMRAWNIAGSMLKAGNRELYDQRKAATEGRVHATPCIRCGPSGKPAQPGTPWSDGHRHADALRIVSKALLRDLWLVARDIHLGQGAVDAHSTSAGVDP
jgi:hypothetical protein